MVSVPSPPNPAQVAGAQGTMNKQTAITQQLLNMVNQNTPFGTLSYKKTGTQMVGGHPVPTFTATTTLSPQEQEIMNQYLQTQQQMGQIGGKQLTQLNQTLSTPFNMNSAIAGQYTDMTSKLLDPVWNQRQSALQSQLQSQGIAPGTQAYTNAMRDFNNQRDTAYNTMQLQGRSQAEQEALAARNQPFNEQAAFRSGSQVQMPNFVSTPQASVQPVDYTGLVNNQYNQQVAQSNATMGGLFGIPTALLGGWGMSGFKLPSFA